MEAKAVNAAGSSFYSKHYVFNYQDGFVKYYRVAKDPSIGYTSVQEITPDAAIQDEVQNLHQLAQTYNANTAPFSPAGGALTSSGLELSSGQQTSCNQTGGVNIYSLLNQSSLRGQYYDNFINERPVANAIAGSLYTIRDIVTNVGINGYTVELPTWLGAVRLNLPTGGTALFHPNPMARTIEIEPGTARDCEKQTVPMRPEEVGNQYNFRSEHMANGFATWLSGLGFQISQPSSSCSSYSTSFVCGSDEICETSVSCN